MKKGVFALALVLAASPALAQFERLNEALNKAKKVRKLADIKMTPEEERQIGQQVSDRLVQEFGVFQDAAVTKYVTLVGTVIVQASPRPNLPWQFVVLDTDGVNAFAAPGGLVHVTRGLLGLMKTEAELAGVLGHEIAHITEKHTVNAIQKSDAISFASDEVSASGGMTQALVAKFADAAYKAVLDSQFSRNDENEADARGVEMVNRVGYAPDGLKNALLKLADRNRGSTERNGLFASHPAIGDRVARIGRTIEERHLAAAASVAPRYAKHITFSAKPASAIAMVPAGSRGLAGDGEKQSAEKKAEPANKLRGGSVLSALTGRGKQAQQSQTVASAGARGVNPDRDAVGGPNKTRLRISVTAAEIADFKKGIA